MISPATTQQADEKFKETGKVGESADKAGVDRKTARQYVKKGAKGPLERVREGRAWRTRPDPFYEVWGEVEQMVGREPKLQAKTIFEELQRRYPGKFTPGQKRSLERRVRAWKDEHGSEPVLIFQSRAPRWRTDAIGLDPLRQARGADCGASLPASFGACRFSFLELGMGAGVPERKLRLPAPGMQSALWEMGGVPKQHQTDQSSTATHSRGNGKGREFNGRYLGLCVYYGMDARVIGVAEPEQNGDVESAHGHLKRAIDQALQMRGSREFTNIQLYEEFVFSVVRQRNATREQKAALEKAALSPLPDERLPEYDAISTEVNREGIARAGKQGYSVPARWIGKKVR